MQIHECCLARLPVWNGNLGTKDEHEKQNKESHSEPKNTNL